MKDENLEDTVDHAGREVPFREQTEIGEAFSNLDSDYVDDKTKMSSIDFNTNLSEFEISSIKKVDEFIRMGLFPEDAGITRQTKRLNISKNGRGRGDKVAIATAGVERHSEGMSVKKLFQRRQE